MNLILMLVLAVAVLAVAAFIVPRAAREYQQRGLVTAFNIGETTKEGTIGLKAAATLTEDCVFVKKNGTPGEMALCGVADMPIGLVDDQPEAGDRAAVYLLGLSKRTLHVRVSEAVTEDEEIYVAANGRAQDLPVGAGTYWKVGRAMHAQANVGEKVEFEPCYPVKLVLT